MSEGVSTPSREELALALAGAMDETARKAQAHAATMQEQGERLIKDAARLEQDALKLLAGAEAMGLEAGETAREVEEVADHGTSVNSRGQKITFEVVRDVAQRLGSFDRAQFADDLALRPIIASRWLARLREQKVVDVDEDPAEGDGPLYVFVRPVGSSPPRPRRPEPDHRDEADDAGPGPGSSVTLTRHQETRKLIREIEAEGGTVTMGGGGHLQVRGPGGKCTIAKTPGSANLRKTRANVRRLTGLNV